MRKKKSKSPDLKEFSWYAPLENQQRNREKSFIDMEKIEITLQLCHLIFKYCELYLGPSENCLVFLEKQRRAPVQGHIPALGQLAGVG